MDNTRTTRGQHADNPNADNTRTTRGHPPTSSFFFPVHLFFKKLKQNTKMKKIEREREREKENVINTDNSTADNSMKTQTRTTETRTTQIRTTRGQTRTTQTRPTRGQPNTQTTQTRTKRGQHADTPNADNTQTYEDNIQQVLFSFFFSVYLFFKKVNKNNNLKRKEREKKT
jgi:hypothetical protein